MKTYLIEPKAPLVIRSGRPFDGQAGADDARFPPPSTLAGALRTAHAETTGKTLGPDLASIAVAGPLPVRLDNKPELLVPRPADALYFWNEDKTAVILARTTPKPLEEDEGCDLPGDLLTVQLPGKIKSKPASGPRWWAFSDLLAWRSAVSPAPTFERIEQNGWSPLPDVMRTHVGIERTSQAAEAGKLFQTAGLDFWCRPDQGQDFPEHRIGLVGQIAGDIAEGLITLGGERRLSAIGPAPVGLWPTLPGDLVANIKQAGGLSLTLLTPALFAAGWRPAEIPGLKLVAAALDRWQPHSGWDLAAKPEGKPWQGGQPRAGRKLVPAGAVYWYQLVGDADLAALWLASLADHEQDRRDGFGLVLPQPWTPV
jgi:CRISPR-associated protein Cmr3